MPPLVYTTRVHIALSGAVDHAGQTIVQADFGAVRLAPFAQRREPAGGQYADEPFLLGRLDIAAGPVGAGLGPPGRCGGGPVSP